MDNKRNDSKPIKWKEKSLSLVISQLGQEGKSLVSKFAIQNNLKILPFNVWLEKGNSKCCLNKLMVEKNKKEKENKTRSKGT